MAFALYLTMAALLGFAAGRQARRLREVKLAAGGADATALRLARAHGGLVGVATFTALLVLRLLGSGDIGPAGPPLLDFDRWLAVSMAFAGGIAVAILLAAAVLAGRPAGLRRLWLELLLVGGGSALFAGVIAVTELNRRWDDSPAEARSLRVVELARVDDIHSDTHYFAIVEDGPGRRLRIRVPTDRYGRLAVGDVLPLRQHAGWLGIRWAEPLEQPGSSN